MNAFVLMFARGSLWVVLTSPCFAWADQYMCKDGTVTREARSAAPGRISVKVIADEDAKTCHFSIAGEAISSSATASTSGSSTRNGDASDTASARANEDQAAIRAGAFRVPSDGGQAAVVLTPLLFGTDAAPPQLARLLSRSDIRNNLERCLASRSDRREEQSLGRDGSVELRCGTTGVGNSLNFGNITAAITFPKKYVLLQAGRRTTIVFIPIN